MDGLETFVGRTHVVLVHLPAGLLLAAGALEVYNRARRGHSPAPHDRTVAWMLYVGTAFAALSCIAGWVLAEGETFSGRSATDIEWHRWIGIGTTVTGLIAAAIKIFAGKEANTMMKTAFSGLVVVAALGVGTTGYFGGNLVHGNDYFRSAFDVEDTAPAVVNHTDTQAGTSTNNAIADTGQSKKSVPSETKKDAPKDATTGGIAQGKKGAKVDFKTEVWPIFEKSCHRCHDAEKRKGKLRLDKKKYAFKSDDVIVPGKPEKSSLYKLIALPQDHDDYMPSKGDPLTKAQVELIKRWIQEGAVWPDK